MKRWYQRKKIKHFLAEAFLIILSVLLALFLNEYRSHIKDDNAREKAQENITRELVTNKEILDEYIPYHKELLGRLQQVISNDSAVAALITPIGLNLSRLAPRGLMQEFPNDAAWQTVRTQDLMSEVNYTLLYNLTDTYDQQEITLDVVDGVTGIVMSREALDPAQARRTLILLFYQLQELVGRESTLQQKYVESLELLEKEEF